MSRQVIAASRRGAATLRRRGSLHPLQFCRQLRIRGLARSPELIEQACLRGGIDRVGHEHAGLTAGAFDLHAQPLEVFARFGGIRQHVDGLLEGDGAKCLQAAPGPDAQIGRRRRQLMHEHQPAARRGGGRTSSGLGVRLHRDVTTVAQYTRGSFRPTPGNCRAPANRFLTGSV